MIVVQQIRMTWERDGRGSELAQKRARVPEGMRLPDFDRTRGYVIHRLLARGPEFSLEPASAQVTDEPPRQDDFLRYGTDIVWRASEAWAPPRQDVTLDFEGRRFIRVRFNGRTNDAHYGELSSWVYQSVVLNVGRFDDAPARDVFVCGPPDHVIDLRAQLW